MRSLLGADLLVLVRNRVSGFVAVLVPVVVVIATSFGKRTGALGGSDLTIGLAITIGLITSSLLGYALSMAQDRHVGVLQRLRVTPAPTWMIMASRLIVQIVANLIVSLIVLIIGVIIHGLSLNAGEYVLVLAVAVFGAAIFLAIGQALVGLVDSVSAVNAISRILFVLLILLGLLGSTGVLGDVIKAISQWTPVGLLMVLFSDALTLAAWTWQDTGALLAGAGYIVVFAFIGIRWFRWDVR